MEPPHTTLRYGLVESPWAPPRTPEPSATSEDKEPTSPPSPPRQPKLRVKRRVGSSLSAPTQQFLASVAAAENRPADMPIPSIEEPDFTLEDATEMECQIVPACQPQPFDEMALSPQVRGRIVFPPKTPAPGMAPSLSPRRYPDWSVDSSSSRESSPDYESSRPSTARSTLTSGSIFSRISCHSDEQQLASPDVQNRESKPTCASSLEASGDEPAAKRVKRRAPWTKAMSNHLWAVYVQYLQDPTKTPVRMGKSCIPPQGVCSRVAREAKRSWRGNRTPSKAAPHSSDNKSGSTTPKADSSTTYMLWPHSTAATRAYLRDLCKQQASVSGVRNKHFMSKSPTPFYQRRKNGNTPSAFTSQDMNKSLIISTAESMKPDGPLAKLTQEGVTPESVPTPTTQAPAPSEPASLVPPVSLDSPPRLASPFGARSYGPSSSSSLPLAGVTRTSVQRHTVGGRRNTLQSPVRLSRPGSCQKRRTKQLSLDARRRPGLGTDIFQEPGIGACGPETNTSRTVASLEDPFSPCGAEIQTNQSAGRARGHTVWAAPATATAGLASPLEPLPRLGSPFPTSNNCHSVPNRFSLPDNMNMDALRRPFATVQQIVEPHSPVPQPRNLANRLAYIDQRLRELNSRESLQQSSESRR